MSPRRMHARRAEQSAENDLAGPVPPHDLEAEKAVLGHDELPSTEPDPVEARALRDEATSHGNGDTPAGQISESADGAVLIENDEHQGGSTDSPLADLLNKLEAFVRRYVAFPSPHQATAIALWIAHTYVHDHFDVSPFLHVASPEKRSGKTRLLETLEVLAWDLASRVTF